MDKDWDARFQKSEKRPFSPWLKWLLILIIPAPLLPWWLTVGLLAAIIGVIGLATLFKAKDGGT